MTLSTNVPAGSLIRVAAFGGQSTGAGTVSDTAGNSYTLRTSAHPNGVTADGTLQLFECPNCLALSSGNTIKYTTGSGSSNIFLECAYATGVATSSPNDSGATNTATGSSTTPSVTSGSPAQSGEVFFATVMFFANVASPTQPSGWTGLTTESNGTVNETLTSGYIVNAGTGTETYNPTGLTPSSFWAALIVAYKPAVASPFVQADWPTPVPTLFPTSLRTWATSYNPNLVGKDQLPNRQQDWPLPNPGPAYAIQLRTWTWSYNQNLIGQDQLPFRQQDWPLPTQPAYFAQWRTWTWSYNLNLIGKDQLPFRQQDWPLPGRPDGFAQWRSWLWWYNQNLIGQDVLPFRQQDWPLPGRPDGFAQWRSWTWNYNPNLIGQDKLPNRQQDWPVPVAPAYAIQLRTWTWTVLPLLSPVGTPFGQFDWPLPIQPPFPIVLRSWAWTYNPNLVGKDSLPFKQQDWPLPTPGPRVVADAQPNLLLTTLAPPAPPSTELHDSPFVFGHVGRLMIH